MTPGGQQPNNYETWYKIRFINISQMKKTRKGPSKKIFVTHLSKELKEALPGNIDA